MTPEAAQLLRMIPQVEKLLVSPPCEALLDEYPRPLLTEVLREMLESYRQALLNPQNIVEDNAADRNRVPSRVTPLSAESLSPESLAAAARFQLEQALAPYYCRVINATGIVLHTALGRAPLPMAAVEALRTRAGYPVRVEMDLESGDRGGRDEGCARLLRELTHAPAATVVNNNAGATLLILAALARGKKVLLSRGEMVEIGGSYRVPDIMEEGGARLVDIGTTNRTHLYDYERAIDEDTGMILKVHTSNYMVKGFTKEVSIAELAELGRKHGIPVVHDLGSGCFVDLEQRGISGEPHVTKSVEAGADLVCFSGDKLLGGPQSGLIVGTEESVQRCRKHPMFRALRPDRLTYIALEATLQIYRGGERNAIEHIPSLARLLAEPAELEQRARRLAERINTRLGEQRSLEVSVIPEFSQAGSGSLPTRNLPTFCCQLREVSGSTQELARKLRMADPSVLTRVRDDALLLDVRTLLDDEFDVIAERIADSIPR